MLLKEFFSVIMCGLHYQSITNATYYDILSVWDVCMYLILTVIGHSISEAMFIRIKSLKLTVKLGVICCVNQVNV